MLLLVIVMLLLLLAIAGEPLFVVIALAAILGFYISGVELSVITIEIYRLTETPLLLALPLFTFAGYLLSESNTSQRTVRLARSLLGWLPGEMILVTLTACAIFTAFTGASGIQYGLRLVECLLAADRRVYLMVSQAAQVVVTAATTGHSTSPAPPTTASRSGSPASMRR